MAQRIARTTSGHSATGTWFHSLQSIGPASSLASCDSFLTTFGLAPLPRSHLPFTISASSLVEGSPRAAASVGSTYAQKKKSAVEQNMAPSLVGSSSMAGRLKLVCFLPSDKVTSNRPLLFLPAWTSLPARLPCFAISSCKRWRRGQLAAAAVGLMSRFRRG